MTRINRRCHEGELCKRICTFWLFNLLLYLSGSVCIAAQNSAHASSGHSKASNAQAVTFGSKQSSGIHHSHKRVIVKYKPSSHKSAITALTRQVGGRIIYVSRHLTNLNVIQVSDNQDINALLRDLNNNALVEYAEPDYRLNVRELFPNEGLFKELWGLHNTGQSGGAVDADINAPAAWSTTTGSADVVVAVVDTGIDYSHVDLADNIWVNPGEIAGNGIDDDGNGYIDDIHGIDSADDDSDPMDDTGHGTHVAGTIGARGNNNEGMVGVNWQVKMVACKIFGLDNNQLHAFVSDAIECLDYLADLKINRGIDIIATNNSWGWVGERSQALFEAIERQAQAGILFVASSGNDSINTDDVRDFPSTYYSANVISVAATTRHDSRATFSNFGRHSVHLGAPGVSILSTVPGGSEFAPPGQNPHNEIFLDGTENGSGNWIAEDTWSITSNEAFNGDSSWTDSPDGDYAVNSITSLTSESFDLTSWSSSPIFLGFYTKYFLEEGFDGVEVQISSNDGVSWTSIATLTGLIPSWQFFSSEIPSNFYTDSFRFRFSLTSDAIIAADGIYLDDIGLGITPFVPQAASGSTALAFKDGTSMASPHVTGVLALAKAQKPARSWSELKNLIISSGSPIASLNTTTISGRRLRAADSDGTGALSCTDQTVLARLKPLRDEVIMGEAGLLDVSMLHINCESPAGNINVMLDGLNDTFELKDDGSGFDQFAGDGIYSAQLDLSRITEAEVTVVFPDGGRVEVKRVKNYLPGKLPQPQWRDIAAVRQLIFSGDDALHIIDTPFLIQFPGVEGGLDGMAISSNGVVIPRNRNDFSSLLAHHENAPLPTLLYNRVVSPFWDDLTAFNSGNLSWGILGEVPGRELVVEWNDVRHFNHNTDGVSFQVVFFENSTDVLFNYKDVIFENTNANLDISQAASATVGIQISPNLAQQHSFNTPKLENDTSLLYSIVNSVPQLSPVENKFLIEGQSLSFTVTATDENVIKPVLSIQELPAGASFDIRTGQFNWIKAGPPGIYTVIITATDAADPQLTDTMSITIEVEENIAPVLSPVSNVQVLKGELFEQHIDVSDSNNTFVFVNVIDLPEGASYDDSSRMITWNNTAPGEYDIAIVAVDSIDSSLVDFTTFTLSVVDSIEDNAQPVLQSIDNQSVIEGEDIVIEISATDADMTRPQLSVDGLPTGATFNADTGFFSWPDSGPPGSYEISFVATDELAPELVDTRTVIVQIEQNIPPSIESIDDINLLEGESISVAISVSDANQTPVIVNVTGLPAGAIFDTENMTVGWNNAMLGQYHITVVASDSINPALVSTETFTLSVVAPIINVPPGLKPLSDIERIEGEDVQFIVEAADENGTNPLLDISGLPQGASFDRTTGFFNWDHAGPSGHYQVMVIANDAENPQLMVSQLVNIHLEENIAPSIRPIADSVIEAGVEFSLALIVSDANGTQSHIQVLGLPEAATYNASELTISWLQPVAGVYELTVLAVDDINPQLVDVKSFTINVGDLQDSEKPPIQENEKKKSGGGGSSNFYWLLLLVFWLVGKSIFRPRVLHSFQ